MKNLVDEEYKVIFNSIIDKYRRCPLKEIEQYGLTEGLGGITIIYYLLSEYTGSPELAVAAKNAIDKLFEGASEMRSLDFEDGLTGICWGIEWLKDNRLINYNTDEILEEVDDVVYNNLFSKIGKDDTDIEDIIDLSKYLLSRFKSRNLSSRYIKIIHQECLLLSLDYAVKKTISSNILIQSRENLISGKCFLLLKDQILLLNEITEHRLNIPQLEEKLYSLIDLAESVLANSLSVPDQLVTEKKWTILLKLALAYYWVGKTQNFNVWKIKATKHIKWLCDFAIREEILLKAENCGIFLFSMSFISDEKGWRGEPFDYGVISPEILNMHLQSEEAQFVLFALSTLTLDKKRWIEIFLI
jgi:hypothetical protein